MVVEEVLRKSEWDHEEEVGKMGRRWGGSTEGEVENAKELDVRRIWDAVVSVTEGKRGEVRAKIEELLEEKKANAGGWILSISREQDQNPSACLTEIVYAVSTDEPRSGLVGSESLFGKPCV